MNLANLVARADLLARLRQFFRDQGFLEVETPLLADEVIPERHIEPLRTSGGQFLQASPELYMKRLLAAGAGAIVQVTRSFRDGERGRLHRPEFTIVEWYRPGDDMAAGMQLVDLLMQSLLQTGPCRQTSYGDAFLHATALNPHTASVAELADVARQRAADYQPTGQEDRNLWLELLHARLVEPELGRDVPELLYHYPASQAALATTTSNEQGEPVAERFELYWQGIELANGYCELTDAAELRRRLEAENQARVMMGRAKLPLPESLLAALERGLPDCTGCALGFDRLVMLAVGATSIGDVIDLSSAPPSSTCNWGGTRRLCNG